MSFKKVSVGVLVLFVLLSQVFMFIQINQIQKTIDGDGGTVNTSEQIAYVTGFNWLQLNNKSDNKIHMFDGQVRVTSPNFNWGGDIVATRDWVIDNVSSECFAGE